MRFRRRNPFIAWIGYITRLATLPRWSRPIPIESLALQLAISTFYVAMV